MEEAILFCRIKPKEKVYIKSKVEDPEAHLSPVLIYFAAIPVCEMHRKLVISLGAAQKCFGNKKLKVKRDKTFAGCISILLNL